MLGQGWYGGGEWQEGRGGVWSNESRRGGGEVVMGDGVCRESECHGMGSGSGHGSQGFGSEGGGGKWVREEQGGRGHGNRVGAGSMVGNWGWEQGVGSEDWAGGRVSGMRTEW